MAPSGIRGLTKKADDQGESFAQNVSRWKITILLRQVFATGQLTRMQASGNQVIGILCLRPGCGFLARKFPDSSPIRVSYPPAIGGKTAILSPCLGIVSRSACTPLRNIIFGTSRLMPSRLRISPILVPSSISIRSASVPRLVFCRARVAYRLI